MKRRVFPLLLFLWCMAFPAPTTAQTNPIQWTVEVGFNGSYKGGAWIPVTIDIANSGDDLRGRLEWRWSTTSARWSQDIDLPRGANKRVVLPVVADTPVGAGATLELRDGDRVIRSERIRSTQIDVSRAVIGVVSASSNALTDVGSMYADIASGAVLVRVDPAAMPDRAEFLQTFDILFVHDADTNAWTDVQRAALVTWVAEGGRIIVGGDQARTAAGIAAIAAATVGDSARDVPLSALTDQTAFRTADPNATTRALTLTPADGAQVVVAAQDGTPLVVRRSFGGGQVIQTAFNLEVVSVAGETTAMWEQLLPWSEHSRQWSQLRGAGESLLRQGLNLPGLSLPSIWLLIGFLVVYIALVGPINYLILRRLDRREWAYLTIPATVLVFTLGAYLIGASGRGGSPTATAIALVRAVPGSDQAHGMTYMGVFSPTRRAYQAELPADALVSNPFSIWAQGEETLPVVRTEAAVAVPDFLIDVGSLRPLLVETPATAPVMQASYRRDGEAYVIDLENRSTGPLEDVAVLIGENITQVDNLAPGERRSVRVDDPMTFMNATFADTERVRRASATDAIRWSFSGQPMAVLPEDIVVAPVLGEDGSADKPVSVLVWADGTPTSSITLNGTAVDIAGETMYIWPVREVRP